ncbi:HEAT repeat domain-containing protein [Streptomyces sp. NRRL B-24572]|uniref:HEAT repeat domain-containing protein n=1 Tax=Streptomyces sp. NRRL B-24572 TaxID=1962156 RepID=UPI0015C4E85A|nr:HEAT repeat domain-containing protein [Streptomyces sp. NRRL B-24572]
MDDTHTEAATRLARGTPLTSAVDTSDAAAWTGLDLAVRQLARTSPSALPDHAWATGRRFHWSWDAPLPTLNLRLREPDEPGLALALCHPDGRIREAALRRAARLPAPALRPLLPLVAIRCADWAGPVREAARDLLRTALPGAGPDTIAVLAPVVLRVAARRHGEAARTLLEAALREGPTPLLDTGLVCDDRATRRLAYRIAVERRHFSPERFAEAAATDPDVVIQDICADGAVAGVGPETGDEVLAPLLRSPHSRVRAAGVTALRRAGRPGEAEAFLADRSGLVRACARYVLRQYGIEAAPLYRALCGGKSVPPAAPRGLGECGARDDAALLWGLTDHPHPGVRAGAVAGLRVLDVTDVARLMPLLDDPAPGVVRETTAALVPYHERLPVDALRARLATEHPRHVRVAAFRLLLAHAGPDLREIAWTLIDDAEPKLRANSWALLRS